jgi:ATP-binding cassette, subfamily C, bacterial LapB
MIVQQPDAAGFVDRSVAQFGGAAQLAWCLDYLSRARGIALDKLDVAAALSGLNASQRWQERLISVASHLGFVAPEFTKSVDRVELPLICFSSEVGWGVVAEVRPDDKLRILVPGGEYFEYASASKNQFAIFSLTLEKNQNEILSGDKQVETFSGLVRAVFKKHAADFFWIGLASIFVGLITMMISLFSMQVYDRVIPTKGYDTLIILVCGVIIALILEMFIKVMRSRLSDYITSEVDGNLSREVFSKLMRLRIDQFPKSVGSLAAQLRGYEQVRSFYTTNMLFFLVDLPLAVTFLIAMVYIAGPVIAIIPLTFAIIAILIGLRIRSRIEQLTASGARFANMKTGLLVEAVEGAETIKAGAGSWKFLSRWISINSWALRNELQVRHSSEISGFLTSLLQQVSYTALITAGAYLVIQGDLSVGGIIACSILSGRVLAPVATIPNLVIQRGYAKAAMSGIEQIFSLKTDNNGIDHPLIPERIAGNLRCERVSFSYSEEASRPSLAIEKLEIASGERVAILGPIGSGKSTLIRLLGGIYASQTGSVFLDGLDIQHIHRDVLNKNIGYLQQDHRLFHGTLKENLLIGTADPGDGRLFTAMTKTGLDRVAQSDPRGLERVITEGGGGLSGGQKQLVAFTRLLLEDPSVLLLDEPTANMDTEQEVKCLSVLQGEIARGKTLVVVTHKLSLLPLVERVIFVMDGRIVMDGPRDKVLAAIRSTKRPTVASGDATDGAFAPADIASEASS